MIGDPVLRREDARLLRGQGAYTDDLVLPDQLYAVMVRSPLAHARVSRIDAADAVSMPGVVTVLTGADYQSDGLAGICHSANPWGAVEWDKPSLVNRDGLEPVDLPQPPIVHTRVRHAGEILAVVVGRTPEAARDAALEVRCDLEEFPAVTDALAAAEAGAPQLWEECPGNLPVDSELGDADATDKAFAQAEHIVEGRFTNNRILNCQMEPRSAIGEWNGETGRLTLHAGSQGVHRLKGMLAQTFGLEPDRIRVTCGDVGGGFGPRNMLYPEFVLVCWASQRAGSPVKWTSDRSEAFVTDFQARDIQTHAALALDGEGRFLALRADLVGNLGAHTVAFVPLANGPRLLPSIYRMDASYSRIRGVLTNTVPTGPYRGAGRPEVMHVVERLIDMAALETGMDRLELRRRNMITQEAMPAANAMGVEYDCGDFPGCFDKALQASRWESFEERRSVSARHGRLRGIGVAGYIQAPVGAPVEYARVRVRGNGRIDLEMGTQSSGQGHETVFPHVVGEFLGVDPETVQLVTGDSDIIPVGGGSHSDRSMRLGGIVMKETSDKIVETGRTVASELLEAAPEDIDYGDGAYHVSGTDRSITLFEVAARSPDGQLSAETVFRGRSHAFPNGAAVSEVEIDPETGAVALVAHTAVDDPGRAINPLILTGQAHGSIAQAIGQSLLEDGVYDPATGQLIAGSFMDYALPRADDLPSFGTALHEVPTANNPLGVKGGGEGATLSGPVAFVNAVCDALRSSKVRDIAMPVTSERVLRAMNRLPGDASRRDVAR